MRNDLFEETIFFFSEKLKTSPFLKDVEKKHVHLKVDEWPISIKEGSLEGSLQMKIRLGLMLQPVREQRLKELATSNFLGINTGGCTLAFDALAVTLSLHCQTSPGTNLQEKWEWLHRIICVAREWNKLLALWEEFVPLTPMLKKL